MAGTSTQSALRVSREKCEETVRLVLESTTFARSEKLQKFLRYVADVTLRGDASLLHEHLIAVEVFGRGVEFSPGEDSVVRRQAHALRKKLKDYYETEGRLDTVLLDLPVGSYVPVFKERAEAVPEIGPTNPVVAPIRLARRPAWVRAVSALVLVSLGFAAGWAVNWYSSKAPAQAAPMDKALTELWSAWMGVNSKAVFAFSNPPSASVRQFAGPIQPNREHQGVAVSPEQDAEFRRFFGFKPGGNLYLYPLAAQAKMGEAMAAVELAKLLTQAGVGVKPLQSRLVTWETLKQENVILLGHADSNQWVEPVLASTPFSLLPTDPKRRARILNRSPKTGEQAEYFPTLPVETKSYALISMLAGVDGAHQVLVIGGLDTSSTTAAAEYLVTPDAVRDLLTKLRAMAPNHQGPWRFQAVLETDVRDTVPMKAFPIALRVL